MLEVTKENFAQEVLESDQVVMVDWWGPKCEHCLELMPDIEKLAEKYKDKMKFCSVNVSGNRRLAISYKVLGLPAILFFRNGKRLMSYQVRILLLKISNLRYNNTLRNRREVLL